MVSEPQCARCTALCASRSQIVQHDFSVSGTPCPILVVGEAPGADEDAQGRGFVGRAGRTLHRLLEEQGLQRGMDYGCANIVRCRPPDNRKPTAEEVWNCLPYLAETVMNTRPQAILLVGSTAVSVFCGTGSLSAHLEELRENRYLPNSLLLHPLLRDSFSGDFMPRFFAIPHTSPLAWNRNTPDGRKWSDVGKEQVKLLKRYISRGEL